MKRNRKKQCWGSRLGLSPQQISSIENDKRPHYIVAAEHGIGRSTVLRIKQRAGEHRMPRNRSVEQRFEEKYTPEPMSGCWLWTAADMPGGYGQFSMGGYNNSEYAHRAAWRLYRGAVPVGLQVLHQCDNRLCVNPLHLFLGTQRDNMEDMDAKGRGSRYGGAKLTEDDVRAIRQDPRSHSEVAADYGICFQNVSHIKRRKTWKHVS